MFEEYGCGCILSAFQGRVRVCGGHRNLIDYHTDPKTGAVTWTVKKFDPSGKIVARYAANGEK